MMINLTSRYQRHKEIGKGSYGSVYEGYDLQKKMKVALKKTIPDFEYDLNNYLEFHYLTLLDHPNIVKLYDCFVLRDVCSFVRRDSDAQCYDNHSDLYLVLEYQDTDIYRSILNNKYLNIKEISRQLLQAMSYLHKKNLIHRDLKSSNILVNDEGDTIKIADWMTCCETDNKDRLTEEATTLPYAAPEVLVNCERYCPASDVWSIGCIISEISLRKIIFYDPHSCNNIGILDKIFRTIGEPSNEMEWLKDANFRIELNRYPKRDGSSNKLIINLFERMMVAIDDKLIDLISKLLDYDVKQRITAEEALKHPYFT